MIVELPEFLFFSIEGMAKQTPQFAIASDMDAGPPKTRPLQKFDSDVDTLTVYMEVSRQREFMKWWSDTMGFGVELLRCPHPVTGIVTVFKIENLEFVATLVGRNILSIDLLVRNFYDN